ncbi:T9SS type A sorting domain-containing protein [Flavobacterium sangjuense]|uniref:Secretion system C-terminal sorting domain-containing protein n=1 Tax=Flavobacterium sangjuense TaxID=2518177 RepID=A0A4P7PX15_9FLAO|nr:T9SS type A sorting domain-containing protein [Flavobacterium sangjuense]QBZ99050.1 hypothetical protein GS03_02566 [Flavobacterium sangjuense]
MTIFYFRKTFIVLIFLAASTFTYSQNNTTSSGGQANGSGGSASYSVGQVVYNMQSGSNGNIIQGVQQPFEIMVLSNPDFQPINLVFKVAPNPAAEVLYLTSDENFDLTNVNYALFDSTGKISRHTIPVNQQTQAIPMENLPQGFYILTVSKNNQVLKSFKIIKK